MALLKFKIGEDEYSADKLAKVLLHNMSVYEDLEKMTDEEKQLFREAMQYTINGIKDGSISNIGIDGIMQDSRGQGNSMMGLAVRYIRDLTNQDEANALRIEKKAYDKDIESAFKNYFNAGKDIDDDFIDRWNKKSYRTKLLDAANFILDRINKINSGEEDMGDTDSSSEIANLQSALAAIKDGKVEDGEFSAFDKIGWNSASKLLTNGTLSKTADWEKTLREELKSEGYTDLEIESLVAMERQSRKWDRLDAYLEKVDEHNEKVNTRLANLHHKKWTNYANSIYNRTYNKKWNLGLSSYGSNTKEYAKTIANLGINPSYYLKFWLNNPDGTTGLYSNKDWLKNFLSYAVLTPEYASSMFTQDANTGALIINSSVNYGNGRALTYDPTTGTLSELSPDNSLTLLEILYNNWIQKNPAPTVGSNGKRAIFTREGGVLKFLEGGLVTEDLILQALAAGQIDASTAKSYLTLLSSSLETTPTTSTTDLSHFTTALPNVLGDAKASIAADNLRNLKSRASLSGRTAQKQKEYEDYMNHKTGIIPDGFSASDYLRLSNLANDISSIFTSYIPVYGTAVAGAQGLLSMGADLLADIKDKNVSSGDVWKNLGENALIAGLGMIPGGAGKVGKIWKGVKKLAPMVLSAYGLMLEGSDPEVQKSLKKFVDLDDWKDIKTSDWKNFMNVAKMIAFTHNTAKATSLAYNLTLKNWKYSPELIRKFGERSFGSNLAQEANTKMILLGGTDNISSDQAEVNNIKGKAITIKVADGKTLKLTLKPSAYKLLNESIKGEKDSATALKSVNTTINNWMHNNPENYFHEDTSGFKAIRAESTKKAIEGLVIKGDAENASLYEYLAKLIEGKTDKNAKVKLNFAKGDITKDREFTVKDIKALLDTILEKAGINKEDLTDMKDFQTKWEAAKDKLVEAEAAANKLALKNPFMEIIEGTELPFTTTLNEGDIYIPGKFAGKVIRKNNSVNLPDSGQNLGEQFKNWTGEAVDAINPVISDKYTGTSLIAQANRAKAIQARAFEKLYNNPTLASMFNNNWEMANGAGPFRFGISGNATNEEHQKALEKEYDSLTYGDDIAKWKKGKIGDLNWEDSLYGKEWANLESLKGRKLTTEEAQELYTKYTTSEALKTALAKDITSNGTLELGFKDLLKTIFENTLNLNDKELLEALTPIIQTMNKEGKVKGSDLLAELQSLKEAGVSNLEEAVKLKNTIAFNIKHKANSLLTPEGYKSELEDFNRNNPTASTKEREEHMNYWLRNKLGDSYELLTLREILQDNRDLLFAKFKQRLHNEFDNDFDINSSTSEVDQLLSKQSKDDKISDILAALKDTKSNSELLGNTFKLKDLSDLTTEVTSLKSHMNSDEYMDSLKDNNKAKIEEYNMNAEDGKHFNELDATARKDLLKTFELDTIALNRFGSSYEALSEIDKNIVNGLFWNNAKSHLAAARALVTPISYTTIESELMPIGGADSTAKAAILKEFLGDGVAINRKNVRAKLDEMAAKHPSFAGMNIEKQNILNKELSKVASELGSNEDELVKTILIRDLKNPALLLGLKSEDVYNALKEQKTLSKTAAKLGISESDLFALLSESKLSNSLSNLEEINKHPGILKNLGDINELKLKIAKGELDPATLLALIANRSAKEKIAKIISATSDVNVKSFLARYNGKLGSDEVNEKQLSDALKNADMKSILIGPVNATPEQLAKLRAKYEFKKGGAINYLKFLKLGGNIQKFADGGSNNMGFSSTNGRSNWRQNIFDKYSKDILSKIASKSGTDLDNYISMLNNMQDRHAKLYSKYGSDYSGKVSYDKDTYNYLNDYDNYDDFGYNKRQGVDAINLAYASGRYKPYGYAKRTSGDGAEGSFKNDGLYGAITDDRRILGRLSTSGEDDWDEESLNNFNKQLATKGLKMFRDKNNYYKIGKITNGLNSSNNPTGYAEDGKLHPENKTVSTLKNIGKNVGDYIKNNVTDSLEFANYLDSTRVNKLVLKNYLLGLRVSYLSPINMHTDLVRDINSEQLAQINAGKSRNAADMIGTSNGDLKLAYMALVLSNSENLLNATTLAVNAKIEPQKQAIDSELKKVLETNILRKDENNKRENGYVKAVGDFMAQYNLADRTSRKNLLSYFINKANTNEIERKLKLAALDLYLLSHAFDNYLAENAKDRSKYNRYQTLSKKDTLSDSEQKEYDSLGEYLSTLAKKVNKAATYTYLGATPPEEKQSYSYKKGGSVVTKHSVSYSDREFNKYIENNVKHYEKAVDNMSRATLLAIKKALGL